MSTFLLVSVALMSPPSTGEAVADDPSKAAAEAPALSPKELREAYRQAVRISHRSEPAKSVPRLVKTYRLLQRDVKMSNRERTDLKFRLRTRMIVAGNKIIEKVRRDMKKRKREAAKAKREKKKAAKQSGPTGQPSDYASSKAKDEGASGGGDEDEGEELVELIRTVIAPDSWDVAGGPGAIVYYKPLKVLVIRQTQEIHWLIGGFRNALGR